MGTFHFKLPDIGEGVVEAEITAWHVELGARVEEDDPVADAMTDKATIELTSPVAGVVTSLACEAGEMLAVGGVLIAFEVEGEGNTAPEAAVPAPIAPEKSGLAPIPASAPHTAPPQIPNTTPAPRAASGSVLAAPAVRKRAEALGIDLASISHVGERITHTDLDAFLLAGKAAPRHAATPVTEPPSPSAPAPSAKPDVPDLLPGETRHKVIGLRRVIATRMSESKRHIPHFTYVEEIDMTAMEAMRARTNARAGEGAPKLTVLPFLIRALAETLRDWPQFNARYEDEKGYVSRFEDLNLGLAAQTDGGLIVPVLKRAQTLSLSALAAEITRLAEGARNAALGTQDLTGATTTLTSLGPLGGIVTTPVINRPEVAIFGPNKIRKVLALEGGEVTEHKVMNFSVSCDHRVIDGYDAAAMVADLRARLEDPTRLLL